MLTSWVTYIEISALFKPVSICVGWAWLLVTPDIDAQLNIRIFGTENMNDVVSEPQIFVQSVIESNFILIPSFVKEW